MSLNQIKFVLAIICFQFLPFFVTAAEVDNMHAMHQSNISKFDGDFADKTLNVTLEDLELVDQNGVKQKFASDVLGDKVIALNFIYTSCSTACPLVSAIFSQLQKRLGERLGQSVRLVSVSINPVNDSPERLKEYSGRFSAGENWVWLTGDKQKIEQTLKGLGVYAADFSEHPTIVLVGDAEKNTWFRINGLPSPAQLETKIDQFIMARSQNIH